MRVELGSLLNAYHICVVVMVTSRVKDADLKASGNLNSIDPWKFEQAQNFGKVDESGCLMKVDLVLVVNKQSDL